MNKYETYGKKLEELGLFKPIYQDEKITICNVSDWCYYLITNNAGIAICIRKEKMFDIIKNPDGLIKTYLKLPEVEQDKISFYIEMKSLPDILTNMKKKVENNPSLSLIDPELEKQIMQEFGMVGKRK